MCYIYINILPKLIYYHRLTLFCVFLSNCVQVSSDRLLLDTSSLVSLLKITKIKERMVEYG